MPKNKARKITFTRSSVNSTTSHASAQSHKSSTSTKLENDATFAAAASTNSNVNGNTNTNDINAIKSPVAKPRGDKNYMRVMELEKEVLELYKMLDYWKNEAKTMQEDHAESNIKLKDQIRGQKLLLAIRRVVHKHTAKGFHRFADNSI